VTRDPSAAVVDRLRASGSVFAEEEARLLVDSACDADELAAMVERRAAGEPLEHVLGWAEFCGLRVVVTPGVFVPRRRTEFLVREAERRLRSGAVVLDLCCGSGAVGMALAATADGIELHASDVDPGAVTCARRNVEAAGGRVHEGDLFDPLPDELRGRVDVLVANVPYVPTGAIATMPPEARLHEPVVALDGGADGLVVARRVAAQASSWLAPGGALLVETSAVQAQPTATAFSRGGLATEVATSGDGDAVVVIGTRPAS